MMNLKEIAQRLNKGEGVPFMEGRQKGETFPVGSAVTCDDFGFIHGDDGDYVVLSFKEFPSLFFFGGSVVTEKFKALEESTIPEVLAAGLEEGIPVLFTKKKNKAGKREYVAVEFYPLEVE